MSFTERNAQAPRRVLVSSNKPYMAVFSILRRTFDYWAFVNSLSLAEAHREASLNVDAADN